MSAALSAARALTTGTLVAASAASVGIGIHLANDHTAALAATQAYQAPAQTYQAPARTEGSGDDSGGLFGRVLQGQGSSGAGVQSNVSPGITGGSQTRTSGS